MRIVNLIEDTPGVFGCVFEHGLSFYIETEKHKILFDTGASDAFMRNAENMGIDLSEVDTVIISHGHYDHAGGLLSFAELNPSAKIYIHEKAFSEYYNLKNPEPKYIGMDSRIASLPNVVRVCENTAIDEELSLFTSVRGRRLWPRGNSTLKVKRGDRFLQDEFEHEMYLVITDGDRRILLSGCAHNGILNILDEFYNLYDAEPTAVISGFHTVKKEYTEEDDAIVTEIAHELSEMNTEFYSGHCTGEHSLEIMKSVMREKLNVIHSGDNIFDRLDA